MKVDFKKQPFCGDDFDIQKYFKVLKFMPHGWEPDTDAKDGAGYNLFILMRSEECNVVISALNDVPTLVLG